MSAVSLCIAGAVPRAWSWGYGLTLHIKYKSYESVKHLELQVVPLPAREEQLNEKVPRELERQRNLDVYGGVAVVSFKKNISHLHSSLASLPFHQPYNLVEQNNEKRGQRKTAALFSQLGGGFDLTHNLLALGRTTSPWELGACTRWLTFPLWSPWPCAAHGHACSLLLIWVSLSTSLHSFVKRED